MNKKKLLSLFAACLFLFSINQTKAADHVTFSLLNATSTSNTFEFDVYIVNDGTSSLNLGGYQFGINFSSTILNGGTPGTTAFAYIPGTRDAVFTTLTNPSVQYLNSQFKVVASLVPLAGSTSLPIGTPYRLGRFIFTNTVNWLPSSLPNLQLQLVSAAGKTNTIALCYIGSSVTSTTFNNTNGLLGASTSGVSSLTLNIPLPVTISSFTGRHNESNDIIQWSTSSETNNAYFNLQYSNDGTNFATIATIQSKANHGNSNEILNYEFEYTNPVSGHNYYRLEQVDIDKRSTIETQVLDLIRTDNASEINFFPNPASDILNININAIKSSNTIIQLVNLTGRIVKNVQAITNPGTQIFSINTQELANGNYLLQVIQNNNLALTSKVQIRK